MNSENRNNITVIPPLLRTRTVRCCSFCRQAGHNVSRCTSDILLEFEIICANQVRNMNQQEFRIWITQNYTNQHLLLKSFAIRKCHANARFSIILCIESIISYIFRNYRPDISDNNNFEEDVLNILINLRNNGDRNNREEPTIEEIQGIQQLLLREYMLALFNNFVNDVRNQYSENRKLNILSTIENDEICGNCECNICWEEKEVKDFVKLGCNHEFCKDCLIKSLKSDLRENPCCALCRTEVKSLKSRTEFVYSELSNLVA